MRLDSATGDGSAGNFFEQGPSIPPPLHAPGYAASRSENSRLVCLIASLVRGSRPRTRRVVSVADFRGPLSRGSTAGCGPSRSTTPSWAERPNLIDHHRHVHGRGGTLGLSREPRGQFFRRRARHPQTVGCANPGVVGDPASARPQRCADAPPGGAAASSWHRKHHQPTAKGEQEERVGFTRGAPGRATAAPVGCYRAGDVRLGAFGRGRSDVPWRLWLGAVSPRRLHRLSG